MNFAELKDFLDHKAEQYENAAFIESDPILLPHRFHRKEDIEIIAFLVATIAWGNRKSIIKSGDKLIHVLNDHPFEFVMNYQGQPLNFVHRTFNAHDLSFFLLALRNIYENHGGLEEAFSLAKNQSSAKQRIINFRQKFLALPHDSRSDKHLSNPEKNSAAKRINMFLRWMVRDATKGVDFGVWPSISPAELCIPLDVHTSNNARRLGLITRKQDDWKALDELMQQLRQFDPKDPAKYDFALFGLGVFEGF